MTSQSIKKDYKAMYEKAETAVLNMWEKIASKDRKILKQANKILELEAKVKKYEEAEYAYNQKWGKSPKVEVDDAEVDEVGNGLYGFCKDCNFCLVEDDAERATGYCEDCESNL